MKHLPALGLSLLLGSVALASPDWADVPVPAEAGAGHTWEVDGRLSLDFNQKDKAAALAGKAWADAYINGWKGPGRGHFDSDYSRVKNGNLELLARWTAPEKMNLGGVSTTKPLTYPVFVETRMRVSPTVLSSNFWFLSEDDEQELDIVECYGTRGSQSGAGGAVNENDRRAADAPGIAGSNYHFFERDPATNAVIEDHGHDGKYHEPSDGVAYRDGFHRFGAFWKSPEHVEIYYDGRLVRTLKRDNFTDFDGKGFHRPMRLILDVEDHAWRVKAGITPSRESLNDPKQNRMWVDWVRVLRPVAR